MERGVREVKYSIRFLKHLSKLPKEVINKAKEKEKIFRENPFHPLLNTHKLSGKEKTIWAFWITYDYRIKFIFIGNEKVLFLDIGTHNIYK